MLKFESEPDLMADYVLEIGYLHVGGGVNGAASVVSLSSMQQNLLILSVVG